MTWDGLYGFDAADAELSLLPMAARRALDRAGLHLSLAIWQTLPLETRRGLIALGAAPHVHAGAVISQLTAAGANAREQPALADPPASAPPADVIAMLQSGFASALPRWSQLRALDRYVLAQLARRGKHERVQEAAAEIFASARQGSQ